MKRQENQKNEVIKRKVKIRKENENIKENQQAAVHKSLPGVQAPCAVFFILSIWIIKHIDPICSDKDIGSVFRIMWKDEKYIDSKNRALKQAVRRAALLTTET